MKPGGGKEKGSEFERSVCRRLSLWLSEGERGDIFTRNVLSGGSFTNAVKKGSDELALPGDIAANHPIAFTFLKLFSVECKHMKDLNLEGLLFDYQGSSFMAVTYIKSQKQAEKIKADALVVARQNRRPIVLMCSGKIGACFDASVRGRGLRPRSHALHGGLYRLFDFDILLSTTKASTVLANVEKLYSEE